MVVLLLLSVKSKFSRIVDLHPSNRSTTSLSRDMTLEKIKQNTLSCIKRLTPFNELVHDQKNYYLESVTSGAQVIPLYDEQAKLNELK